MIRVLRLLEYTYDSPEQAEQDMGHWGVPQNGVHRVGGPTSTRVIRSSMLTNLMFEADINAADAGRFREIQQIVASNSMARDGLEMIEAAERQRDEC